jgi:hypothetical protein
MAQSSVKIRRIGGRAPRPFFSLVRIIGVKFVMNWNTSSRRLTLVIAIALTGLSAALAVQHAAASVNLDYFRAVPNPGGPGVLVTWHTLNEFETAGFHIYRGVSPDRNASLQINQSLIPGCAGCPTGAYYTFTDSIQNGGPYYYWLVDVTTSNGRTFHETTDGPRPVAPSTPAPTTPTPTPAATAGATDTPIPPSATPLPTDTLAPGRSSATPAPATDTATPAPTNTGVAEQQNSPTPVATDLASKETPTQAPVTSPGPNPQPTEPLPVATTAPGVSPVAATATTGPVTGATAVSQPPQVSVTPYPAEHGSPAAPTAAVAGTPGPAPTRRIVPTAATTPPVVEAGADDPRVQGFALIGLAVAGLAILAGLAWRLLSTPDKPQSGPGSPPPA